jgi:S-formylglutathione hydrolase FrmB
MIVTHAVESTHLARNLLGNPHRRDLAIYLPPGYATSSERRYPSVYLLHGFSSRSTSWGLGPALAFGALMPPLEQLLDEAIAEKRMAEMIVVMPDGWSRFGCSMWVDSPVTGAFEQYVTRELVAYVDSHFRTIATPEARAITGYSAGGFGAWHLGSRNPDVFGTMAVLSGGGNYQARTQATFYRYFDSIYPREPDGPRPGNIDSWFSYAQPAAFAPNPDRPPFYGDFPFEYPSGDVVPGVWDRWLAFDPTLNWESRQDNLRRLRGILLDVGSQDELGLQYAHRILSRRIGAAGIRHEAREHEGTHTSHLRERVTLACGWLSDHLR